MGDNDGESKRLKNRKEYRIRVQVVCRGVAFVLGVRGGEYGVAGGPNVGGSNQGWVLGRTRKKG